MNNLNASFKIAEIIAKEKTGTLTEVELEILQKWLSESEKNRNIYQKLSDGKLLLQQLDEFDKTNVDQAFSMLEKKISIKKLPGIIQFIPAYAKYAAAILFLVISSYFIFNEKNVTVFQNTAQHSIFPGKQKAILVTASNENVILDDTSKKRVFEETGTKITQSGAVLSYNQTDSPKTKISATVFNTLITPKGGEYKLILSDGTEILLNADSKIKYPIAFNGDTREIELHGEALFKVKKSNKKAFLVKTKDVTIKVYGTIFNVMAYENDSQIQTTLLEGSIGLNVGSNSTESRIKPGQQHTLNKVSNTTLTKDVDPEQYVAWTKGMFVFENEPVENILKVMSRWYDFDFKFKDDKLKSQRFTLSLSRYDNVSKVLNLMSLSSGLAFDIDKNTIFVDSK